MLSLIDGRRYGGDPEYESVSKSLALLQQYGLLFVATFDFGSLHAVVVTGPDAEPNPDKATIYINNRATGNSILEILVQKTAREQRVAFIAHRKAT